MRSTKNTDECTALGALLAWRSADLSLDQLGAIKREMNDTDGCTPVYRYTCRCRLDQLGAVERERRSNLNFNSDWQFGQASGVSTAGSEKRR